MRRRHNRSSGFTLVEILLAVALMGMLLALAYGGLRASTRAAEKGQAVLEDASRVRMAQQFVRTRFNQLMPLAFAENDKAERTVFEGEAHRVRYVAPMPGYLGFGGPQVQELSLEPGPEGLELVLRHALLQGFEEGFLYEREPIFLVGNIRSASFMFLGRDPNGNLRDWSSAWETPAELPESVALDIEFNESVYIHWPELIASARTDPGAVAQLLGEAGAEAGLSTTIRRRTDRQRSRQ